MPKVFVSGIFDLLHSGHIEFFRQASAYGDLYVAVGSDRTNFDLKGHLPVNNEEERLYMVKSVGYVKDAFISKGTGILDFVDELKAIQPDYFIVNEDGNIPAKSRMCEELKIKYVVLKRYPHEGLTPRSSSALKTINIMPFRIDICGGWLDQPFCSRVYPGSVITVSIEPTLEFNERSGMASSTRLKAIEIWGPRLPAGDSAKLAKILFCCDNPPGTSYISGSQDSIGIVFPGVNKSYYDGNYWPSRIDKIRNEEIYQFIENAFYLVPLGPRVSGFSVLSDTKINFDGCKALSDAAEACWQAILDRDLAQFGKTVRDGFEAQIAMFPHMMNETIMELIDRFKDQALGWKVSGAGGGGYLILVADHSIENAIRVLVRRDD
ncbi:MAG TPA: adenylyltransferase/cytidyltransferase family protein [Anaerolineaceae bacterium]|nr:adenylyltransferase/cytidyltransferase family protein [Anaerolineaceae bacterium]